MRPEEKAILERIIEKCEEAEVLSKKLSNLRSGEIIMAREYLKYVKIYLEDVYKTDCEVREPLEYKE